MERLLVIQRPPFAQVPKLRITCHFGKRKSLAVIRTTASHVTNLITGVTKVCPPYAAIPSP